MKSHRAQSRVNDKRGNTHDRRVRKLRLLAAYGDGITCPCIHCGEMLTYLTLQADRIEPGGTYAFYNVQPACGTCNASRGDNPNWVGPDPQHITPDRSAAYNPLFLTSDPRNL